MNRNQKIHLTDLIDDAVPNTILRQHQVLNSEESGGVLGGKSEPQVICRLQLTEDVKIEIYNPFEIL